MKNLLNFLKFILVLILGVNGLESNSQNLPESRQTSYYTYIFKLTDKEAEEIYKSDIWKADTSFFHALVDSFPTDSPYTRILPEGHYIKTFSEKNIQKISITTVQNFDVFILNNNTDLCVQVYDLKGNIITDANVSVRWKKLKFNKKTQSYIDRKSNQKGLLKVTYKGFTAYYNLMRDYNNSYIRRGTRKVLYSTPIRYIWRPVNFIIHIPIDGVKSIVHGSTWGAINRIKYFFVRSFYKTACIFNEEYCDYFNYRFRQKHNGYFVFNKPKYLPGDTVKFKAFIVDNNGKPFNKKLKVRLNSYEKNIELGQINPYCKGGYEFQFFLHDSLQLKLDRSYYISLGFKKRKTLIKEELVYEDYELPKNKLTLRFDEKKQYKNKDFKLFVKGTDDNDLNLLDARVEILIKPGTVDKYFEKHAFIPDTLVFFTRYLEAGGETEILIPDSLFPKANFEYDIFVKLFTSDNESVEEKEKINYFYKAEAFDIEMLSDSIQFIFNKNGISENTKVTIKASDNFGNKTSVFDGNTPCKIKINPYYCFYTVRTENLFDSIVISSQPSLLQCYTERRKDTISIIVNNPRKLLFSFVIYEKNKQIAEGFSDSLIENIKNPSKETYYVSIRYVWGGKIVKETYSIPYVDKNLNVSVKQPKIVFPGQESLIEITVTDAFGKPVNGVDLTAYSLTGKFEYTPPDLPYLGKMRKGKMIINNFGVDEDIVFNRKTELDYGAWKELAALDSIEYYKFIYPEKAIYRFEYCLKDSITQFAPFVMSEGVIQPIHVIYVDNKPVYFSWSTNIQPYSFKINNGYHKIGLRTSVKSITIDSMYFNSGKKLIFSLNADLALKNVRCINLKPELSFSEQNTLYRYIFPYKNNFRDKLVFIEQDDNIQFLEAKPQSKYYFDNFAGPVAGNATFHLMDDYSIRFNHEPFYEYEFAPGLLKMNCVSTNKYPRFLCNYQAQSSLSDEIMTRKLLYEKWNKQIEYKRQTTVGYDNPYMTRIGSGRLSYKLSKQDKGIVEMPLNILVFKNDDYNFLRVYPGKTTLIHDLKKGYYRFIFFYTDSKYQVEDSVHIETDGLNYYEFEQPQVLSRDSFSIQVNNILEKAAFKPLLNFYENKKNNELRKIYNLSQLQFKYKGVGSEVHGQVCDKQTGKPVPFVNVVVKGTTYGTVTDIDGNFELNVPVNYNILCFSSIGYMPQIFYIDGATEINVSMNNMPQELEEFVVAEYSVPLICKDQTSSGCTMTSMELQKMPGVMEGSVAVTVGGVFSADGEDLVEIRGARTEGVVTYIDGMKVVGSSVIPQSAIECVKIITGGLPASYGDASKSGAVKIEIPGADAVFFDKTPLFIINGNVFTGDISQLDPKIIERIDILKDPKATALYGLNGANGVVIIKTKGGTFLPLIANAGKGADYDDKFFDAAMQSGLIRENFSDYAFWQPKLTTDKEGKVSFEVKFPDDVTSWGTYFLAMNGKKQSGQTQSIIKSYKPLMAQLAAPRFLVQSDTALVIGKALNYMPDSVEITSQFEINKKKVFSNTRYCVNSLLDTLPVVATRDSVSLKYFFEKKDGFFDGELRSIPVFPLGMEETKGRFYALDKDTSFQLWFDTALGNVSIYAKADIIDVIEDEIKNVIQYKYLCNEQIASKLKVLLAEKNIANYKGVKFKSEKEVDKLIKLLPQQKNNNGLWGWWKDSKESEWISLYIIEALLQAEKLGYKPMLNKEKITGDLIWKLETCTDINLKINLISILNLLKAQINNSLYISEFEKNKKLSLNNLLHIIELKQLNNQKYDLDTIKYYQKTTLFGNVYFSEEGKESNLLVNDIQNTLIAYRILRRDTTSNKELLGKIRNYFLECRNVGYWRNTYESAQIIETILPDLLKNKSELKEPVLSISGGLNIKVNKFPFETTINPTQTLQISKTGDFPVYFNYYQQYWNNKPKETKGDFEISTSFMSDSTLNLKAGEDVTLKVKVLVKKDAEYVMINVPIPGGCSYSNKKNNYSNETHREYFKNETSIFCEHLSKGEYTFEIELSSRYSGSYTLNPAKIELMYFPVFNANCEMKRINIK